VAGVGIGRVGVGDDGVDQVRVGRSNDFDGDLDLVAECGGGRDWWDSEGATIGRGRPPLRYRDQRRLHELDGTE
jgi:hypothetical protein